MKNNTSTRFAWQSFKWIAIAFVSVAFFQSCATQRRCLEKFPPTTTVEIRDSIAFRDTTIFVPIPADTVRDSIPIVSPCPDGQPIRPEYKTKPVTVKNRWSTATAWIERGHLKIDLMTNDTTLAFVIDSAVSERVKQITINQQFVKPKKYIPNIYKFALVGLIIVIILVIAKIALNLRR
jgi:hypothetical protein